MTQPIRPKVLVVDDDEAISDSLCMLLDFEGFEVFTKQDINFLEEVKKIKPDIILLDIWLSGTDGRELCLKIKCDDDTESIPVILISASRNLAKSMEACRADAFVEKPFEIEVVLKTIRDLIPSKFPQPEK